MNTQSEWSYRLNLYSSGMTNKNRNSYILTSPTELYIKLYIHRLLQACERIFSICFLSKQCHMYSIAITCLKIESSILTDTRLSNNSKEIHMWIKAVIRSQMFFRRFYIGLMQRDCKMFNLDFITNLFTYSIYYKEQMFLCSNMYV